MKTWTVFSQIKMKHLPVANIVYGRFNLVFFKTRGEKMHTVHVKLSWLHSFLNAHVYLMYFFALKDITIIYELWTTASSYSVPSNAPSPFLCLHYNASWSEFLPVFSLYITPDFGIWEFYINHSTVIEHP